MLKQELGVDLELDEYYFCTILKVVLYEKIAQRFLDILYYLVNSKYWITGNGCLRYIWGIQ